MNPLLRINVFDFLIKQGLMEIHEDGRFSDSEDGIKTPIKMNQFNWYQPRNIQILAEDIAAKVTNCNRERIGEGKSPITVIAGYGQSQILANRVAEHLGMIYMPSTQNQRWRMGGENAAYVCDILSTGHEMYDAVTGIRMSGANCEKVFCGFDFGFSMTKEPRGVEIRSLLSLKNLIDFPLEPIQKWLEQNHHVKSFLREQPVETEGQPGLSFVDVTG